MFGLENGKGDGKNKIECIVLYLCGLDPSLALCLKENDVLNELFLWLYDKNSFLRNAKYVNVIVGMTTYRKEKEKHIYLNKVHAHLISKFQCITFRKLYLSPWP
jgi:hypothetical protein